MKIELKANQIKELYNNGLPRNIANHESFDTEDHIHTFNSNGDKLKPKRVTQLKQTKALKRIMEDPFYGPYTFCISGSPNDLHAKMVATTIMYKATQMHKQKQTTKLPPKWQNIYLGFDNFVLKEGYRPSLLILSNLTGDCSNQKIDKLRDCLERHSNIPRIVIVGGCDPLHFFNHRVHLALNALVYMQGKQMKTREL